MNKVFVIFLVLLSLAAQSQTHTEHTKTESAKLKPIKKDETRVSIEVPLDQQKKIGLQVVKALRKKVDHTIRTVGTVTADQSKEAHVHTKINGWVEQIYADSIGKPVKKGQPLYELYSPDLVSTQEEYLAARKQGASAREIAQASLERLLLWGVPKSEIERIKKVGKASKSITFDSPVDGVIVNKTAIRGMYISPEMELYQIADLSKVWLIISLYEYDIAVISVGDLAEIQFPYDPSKSFNAKISYIYPEIDLETRTAKARIEIDNRDQKLKPGMFSNILVKKNLGEAIVIPDDAVIDTGTRKIVFVKVAASQFEPREIKAGPRIENNFAILSGLKEGEEIVTSANFLIDAESKLQAAVQEGSSKDAGHSGHEKK